MLDISHIRRAFPALNREVDGSPIVYLDSAATYLKPRSVIDAVCDCYCRHAGTVGRGVHVMSLEAMALFAEARETIANFINADAEEIVFVRSATEAINLVAASLSGGSRIFGSIGEHHSNLLPWRAKHAFHPLTLDDQGEIDIDALTTTLASSQADLVTCSSIGDAFGNIYPVERIIQTAHGFGADAFIDVNQSIAHQRVDVRKLDCDYACFSGHKMGGPTGLGVLFAKSDRLERLQPQLHGGGMVESVTSTKIVLEQVPMRLEAGTVHFEGVIGLAAACEYFEHLGIDNISLHGPRYASNRGVIVSFSIDGLKAHGAARMLSNRTNLCLRSGFHCAQMAHTVR